MDQDQWSISGTDRLPEGTQVARSLRDGHRVEGGAELRVEKCPRFKGLNLVAPALLMAWKFKP